MAAVFVVGLIGLCISIAGPSAEQLTTNSHFVPIARLLVVPEKYDQAVSLIGFLVFDDHEEILYASKEDAVHAIVPNGIELDLTKKWDGSPLTDCDGKYVMITGRFRAPLPGTQAITTGRIVELFEIQEGAAWGRAEPPSFE